MIRTTVLHLLYPIVIAYGLISYVLLQNAGYSIVSSTYVPAVSGAILIVILEFMFPYRKDWIPNRTDVLNDLIFMGLVQILLPRLLSFLVALTLLRFVQFHEWAIDAFWPHTINPFVQALLMMLTAEFLRYWLHRACHESNTLWRLHAVHHSVHKLYWTNVGRFHPIEKMLQYSLDALPFILLGVSEEVLAIYFIFYGLNGFFQHSNIDVRLGFLNYIISGPELHRWHHSYLTKEANANYGNNLIVWDLLFGTRFLPKNRAVEELGLKNRGYPLDFATQMKTPFIKGMDQGS